MATALYNYLGFGRSTSPTTSKGPEAIRALPANWYYSPELYELERRAIFSRKWLILTHQVRLKEAGDFLRYQLAGFDFVVSRDRSGKISAFHNVCRHRAYPVVEQDKGTAKIFSCRYHGWSYGLSGKLAKAPGYQDLDGFDKSQNGLFPIHVRVDVNGFIWVNLDAKKTPEIPWETDFDGVDQQDRFEAFDFGNYEFDHTWSIDADYNWKIAADNYNECMYLQDKSGMRDNANLYLHFRLSLQNDTSRCTRFSRSRSLRCNSQSGTDFARCRDYRRAEKGWPANCQHILLALRLYDCHVSTVDSVV
jgi:nitrite reductase/ring-hydroxylating ferredoxin subunit